MSKRDSGRSKRANATPRSATKFLEHRLRARGARSAAAPAIWAFLVAVLVALTFASSAEAAATTVPLATADSFAILAGAGITNTGPTTVNGDIGTFPTTTMTGTASVTQTGTNHGGDSVTQGAKSDLVTGYNNAAGQGPATPIAADLAGLTLPPGVYNSASSIGLTGALTLDGGGDANAVFIFQAGSTLITASGSTVNLINGAQACNVFWQVGSSATLGTGSTFRGTILALTDISVTTAVTVDGRVLARNGAVTLDTDTITRPTCAAPTTTTTTTPIPTTTTTTTPVPTPTTSPTTTPVPTPTTVPAATPTTASTPAATPTATSSPAASPTARPTTTGTSTPAGTSQPTGVTPTPTPAATPTATRTPTGTPRSRVGLTG